MKITWFSPFPPDRDGIGDYSACLTSGLTRLGSDVTVVRPADLSAWRPDPARDEVVHVQFAIAAFGRHIPHLVRAMRASRRAGLTLVVTAHEVTRDTQRLKGLGRWIYRQVCHLADHVVVHTQLAHRVMVEVIGVEASRVGVVAHPQPPLPTATVGAAELRARHGLEDRPVVLSFGFIHYEKGLDTTVEALGSLVRENPKSDAQLVVAGTVRRRPLLFRPFEWRDRFHLWRVRYRIRALGLSGRVHFTGYVEEGEIAAWFELSTVLVLAYRGIEQTGVGSLASTTGIPIITSDVGTLAADFSEPARTFSPGDDAALAVCLRALLNNSPTARRPAARGVELPTIARQTRRLYAALRASQEMITDESNGSNHESYGSAPAGGAA